VNIPFDVEYIYGFVWWGVCKQSRWRHSVTEPSEDSGYVLLWQRCDNKMVAIRYYVLHLQQYSHRLNIYFCINTQNLNKLHTVIFAYKLPLCLITVYRYCSKMCCVCMFIHFVLSLNLCGTEILYLFPVVCVQTSNLGKFCHINTGWTRRNG